MKAEWFSHLSKLLRYTVVSILKCLLESSKVHRLFDDCVVVRYGLGINSSLEKDSKVSERMTDGFEHSEAFGNELLLCPRVARPVGVRWR